MTKRHVNVIALAALMAVVAAAVAAAELPETTVKAIGLNSKTIVSFGDEVPFWNETIPEASGGKITAEFAPIDLAGIKDPQIMRMTTLGVTDFGAGDISKMAGDDPVFEGCDLAGLALDIETARAACEAWAPVMGRVMEEKFNTKLMALGTNPPQVFWCREPLTGLDDLEGRKIRVFNKTMADFIGAIGGTTISMPFAEVVPALQRGVVDCAVTGTLSGNTAGWPEVSTHLYPMYLGWSINYQGVNLDSWNGWPEEVRAFFTEQFDAFEDKMWDTAAKAVADAENCNFGKEPCEMGKMAQMTLVPISEADKEKHAQLMQDTVLVAWARRCGKDCAAEWNDTVGPVVGLQIPLDQL
ncbi:MAG TPA: TRAP transporter substrate-binding protein [Geminicoccaceae bacterium]|jgi:TRAP-type C4-dicarboxylate transport system substrate-binding protein|nr:TRAP transporter substrate-binding protein [Geminicoccaceae bacterium]